MILNQSQAEAVYSATCAMNKVCACFDITTRIYGDSAQEVITIKFEDGGVSVAIGALRSASERYADHAAFATAYGLQQG